MPNFYPRSAQVIATQYTAANKGSFLMTFNRGRTEAPFLVDTGDVVFLEMGPGVAATAIRRGDWLISHGNDFDVCDDAKFCAEFCPAT